MKTEAQWLAEYARSHQHAVNKRIHRICVPSIMLSIFGMMWFVPLPFFAGPWTNLAVLVALGVLIFYATLGFRCLLEMSFLVLAQLSIVFYLTQRLHWALWLFVGIFVVGWIGQAWGHKLEGKKPSFFEDIQFLLIGPLWIFRG